MTATNNTYAQSSVSAQKGSIVLLSVGLAFVRAALVVLAAVSLGPAARYFFPEMFAIPSSPMVLLAVVAVDTFAITLGLLMVRARSMASQQSH